MRASSRIADGLTLARGSSLSGSCQQQGEVASHHLSCASWGRLERVPMMFFVGDLHVDCLPT